MNNQLDTSKTRELRFGERLLSITGETRREPSQRDVLKMKYLDRLERFWWAVEQAGEYAQPNNDMNQHLKGVNNRGGA